MVPSNFLKTQVTAKITRKRTEMNSSLVIPRTSKNERIKGMAVEKCGKLSSDAWSHAKWDSFFTRKEGNPWQSISNLVCVLNVLGHHLCNSLPTIFSIRCLQKYKATWPNHVQKGKSFEKDLIFFEWSPLWCSFLIAVTEINNYIRSMQDLLNTIHTIQMHIYIHYIYMSSDMPWG